MATSETSDPESIVTVTSGGREYRFGPGDLPIAFGGAPGADVPLPGVPGAVQIGRLGGVFFVQARRSTRNLRLDGELVAGSREIRDGALISLDRARLTCRLSSDGRLTIDTQILTTAGDTAPPDLDEVAREPRAAAGGIPITPIAFDPAATAIGARPVRRRPSKTTIGLAAAFGVLAVLAWFAFTARSVALNIEPKPDDISLPSTLFKFRLGDRFLLRPGPHRVAAELAGYYPLDTEIDVGESPDQSFNLTLTKLPGLVSLKTDPEVAADVRMDGAELGHTPLVDIEIKPGVHRLEFNADRYLAQVLELTVRGGGERQALVASLTPNWAPVSLTTLPPGAEVQVDGEVVGVTPIEMQLTAGEREIEAHLSGYNAWRDKIVVNANEPLTLPDVKLSLADGRVDLASNPSAANVSIDGEYRGRTPLALRLTPGKPHELTLTKPGYETATRELSVAADSGRRVQIELKAQYGEIEVRSDPANADIFVDGERQGATPSRLTLTAIKHRIEVKQPGFATQSADVTPRPGFSQVLPFKLERLDRTSGNGFPAKLRTSLNQELVLIPAGQFTMGSSRREQGRRSNEVLQPVKLTKAFYLGAREVTNAEFRAFRSDHSSGQYDGLSLNDDDQPVVRVTWDDAVQYANWLSIKDGLQPVYEQRQGQWTASRPLRSGYRLPTEAEWAWAARFAGRPAGAGLLFPWGKDIPPPDRSGNYADVSAAKILPTTLVTYNDGYPVSAPSGSFPADALGLHDIGGNVAEWIQDYYSIDVTETDKVLEDPLGPLTGRFHVVRGSSWRSATVTELRSAFRDYSNEAREDLGFRLARNLE
jgi:formylglycine-generating enzyme required for sulfatase activity